ncbi:MAG TPA: hypothetical protein VGM73_06590 [Candidatus Didemnitutus sp.]|jgi:hypothetical protein
MADPANGLAAKAAPSNIPIPAKNLPRAAGNVSVFKRNGSTALERGPFTLALPGQMPGNSLPTFDQAYRSDLACRRLIVRAVGWVNAIEY